MREQTTTTLLEGLTDPANEAIWRAFDTRFRPIVFGFARRMGLSTEEAADATQETLTRFVAGYRQGRYDRGKGRLQAFILGIARNCALETLRAHRQRRERRGMSAIDTLPGADDIEQLWQAQYERAILDEAVRRLRESTNVEQRTIRVFEGIVLQGRSPRDVADELGMSTDEAYVAKHRCLKRVRELADEVRTLYDT